MRLTQLKRPRFTDCAKQCRSMGLMVGNTIVGRETYSDGKWSEAKLTLLWLGKHEAMWAVKRRSSERFVKYRREHPAPLEVRRGKYLANRNRRRAIKGLPPLVFKGGHFVSSINGGGG